MRARSVQARSHSLPPEGGFFFFFFRDGTRRVRDTGNNLLPRRSTHRVAPRREGEGEGGPSARPCSRPRRLLLYEFFIFSKFLMTTASIRSPFTALPTQTLSAHSNIQASSAPAPSPRARLLGDGFLVCRATLLFHY